MKVLLINPPGWVGDRIPLGYDLVPSVPLGLGYLASTMESEGITAKIVDMDWGGFSKEELVDMISKFDPDIIGITSFTSNYANAVDIAKAAKSHNPNIKIVFGGVHATFIHRDVLHTIPEVDIVVRYEGERAICEICDALDRGRKLENVKGISFRHDNRVFSTPLRHRIENLDSIPFPAFHLLEPSIEHYIGEGKEKGFPIITTRGCPFNCIFCSTAALHGRKYRTRSANNVLDEMEFVQDKYKINVISFADDNFTMKRNRVIDICRGIKERNLDFEWGCSARVDLLSKDLLEVMNSSGCKNIFFGIESASQRVLETVKKGFSIENAKEMVKLTEKMGIKTHCSFILGLPNETVESIDEMIRFVEETMPSGRVLPNVLEILPGTELWDKESEYFGNTPSIPAADIIRVQLELFYKFFEISSKGRELLTIEPPDIEIIGGSTAFAQTQM